MGTLRFRVIGTLVRKSGVPAPIPRGVGPASTTPTACGDQRPAPAAKSVADRWSTNSSQRQTRKPTEPRREMVLLAASATFIGAWSRAASSCRILSCVGEPANKLVAMRPCRSTHVAPKPRAIRDWRLHQNSAAPRLSAPCPHTMRARRVWRFCFCGRRRRTGQTTVPRLPRSILEMQPRNLGRMPPKWRNAYSKLRLRASTSRARRVG